MTDYMIFDKEEVMEEFDDDLELLARMQGIFQRDCEERLPKLKAAVENSDFQVIADEAHALKSGVGNFFADKAYQTASELEVMGQNNDSSAIHKTFETLERSITELNKALVDTCADS